MPMSDEQVQALMQNWRDALAKQMDDMRVRQWCVEQAIKAGSDTPAARLALVHLADEIFQFITAPFADTFKD